MRTLRTALTVLLLPLLCCGCVASPALMMSSSAGDNVAYSETGKSMLDFGLSNLLDRDCTVMHGISRGQFCRDVPESRLVDATKAASDKSSRSGTQPTAGNEMRGSYFALTALKATAPDVPATDTAEMESDRAPVFEMPAADEGRWAFVLGVFKEYDQAAELASKLKPNHGVVSSIVDQGELFYRVTTRPFKLNEAAANEKPVVAIGIPDAKMVAVCPGWMRDESCLVLDRNLAR